MDILAVGQGRVLSACAEILRESGVVFSVVETKEPFSFFSVVPHMTRLGVPVMSLSPAELVAHLGASVNPLLVFSIANKVLFPQNIVERSNITIVNYHNASLPGHRGRNCEAWQIYDQEQFAGVTWHYVDAGVDTGAVIRQSVMPLSADVTSIRLLAMQGREAACLFREMLPLLLSGVEKARGEKQATAVHSPLHYSWERPNDGTLDLTWPAGKIWAFLRAMDYGALRTLGIPVLQWNGACYTWQKYTREGAWHEGAKAKICLENSDLIFSFPSGRILLHGCVPNKKSMF